MRTQTELTISVLADLPEDLHAQIKAFLDQQPEWNADRVFMVAIAQFLMQQSFGPEIDTRVAARRYMQGMFDRRPEIQGLRDDQHSKTDTFTAS